MAAVNYFWGGKRGVALNVNNLNSGSATAGTAVDVEVRIQINDGSNATGITRKDALLILEVIEAAIESGGINHDGQNLPAL
jgi:hypothetical protein